MGSYISLGMDTYQFFQGNSPLLISAPHAGIGIPNNIAKSMTDDGKASIDTDRYVDRLYDAAREIGAGMLVATQSRYVVDLNRPKDDQNLYPGQDTTGLCPVNSFDRAPIYLAENVPSAAEINRRIPLYWQPYHDKLRTELTRLKKEYGYALLWDAHSIKSVVPRFFDGQLPDINLGTANGESCGEGVGEVLLDCAKQQSRYSAVLNGRFKGGYITRHYGDPANNIQAVQLELSQITYMDEDTPFDYRPDLAKDIKPVLQALIERYLEIAATTLKPTS